MADGSLNRQSSSKVEFLLENRMKVLIERSFAGLNSDETGLIFRLWKKDNRSFAVLSSLFGVNETLELKVILAAGDLIDSQSDLNVTPQIKMMFAMIKRMKQSSDRVEYLRKLGVLYESLLFRRDTVKDMQLFFSQEIANLLRN